MDVFTRKQRSVIMSKIRSRGNVRTEIALLRLFREHRVTGWRRHLNIPGRPDFAFARSRVAVFVDGCFWHGCRRCRNLPTSNREFWRLKIATNRIRDRKVGRVLCSRGWSVMRVWEHELKDGSRVIAKLVLLLGENSIHQSKLKAST